MVPRAHRCPWLARGGSGDAGDGEGSRRRSGKQRWTESGEGDDSAKLEEVLGVQEVEEVGAVPFLQLDGLGEDVVAGNNVSPPEYRGGNGDDGESMGASRLKLLGGEVEDDEARRFPSVAGLGDDEDGGTELALLAAMAGATR